MALTNRQSGAKHWVPSLFAFFWILLAGFSTLYLIGLVVDPPAQGDEVVASSTPMPSPQGDSDDDDSQTAEQVAALAEANNARGQDMDSVKSAMRDLTHKMDEFNKRLKPIEKILGPVAALPPATSVTTSLPTPEPLVPAEPEQAETPASPEPEIPAEKPKAVEAPKPIEAPKPSLAEPKPVETRKPTLAEPKPVEAPKPALAEPKPVEPKPTLAEPKPVETPKPAVAEPKPVETPKPTLATPKPEEKPAPSTTAAVSPAPEPAEGGAEGLQDEVSPADDTETPEDSSSAAPPAEDSVVSASPDDAPPADNSTSPTPADDPSSPPAAPTEIAKFDPVALPPAANDGSTRFGIEIGSTDSQNGLRPLWREYLSKHAALVAGLQPRRVLAPDKKWRLIAGPFSNAVEAAQACVLFKKVERPCEATVYAGDSL